MSSSDPTYNVMSNVGTNALWCGFAALVISTIRIFVKAFTRLPSQRIFHYLAFGVTGVASLCYLCMAAGIGQVTVNGRQLFFVRYIDWLLTTPLLLTSLGMLARLSASNIFALIVLDVLMISAGVLGALAKGPVAWGFFAFGCVCFLPLVYFLFEDFDLERSSKGVGQKSANSYKSLSYTLASLWCFYPLLWILTVTQAISTDGEVVFYMVLDVASKAIFELWLVGTEPTMPEDDDEDEEEEEEEEDEEVGEMKVEKAAPPMPMDSNRSTAPSVRSRQTTQ